MKFKVFMMLTVVMTVAMFPSCSEDEDSLATEENLLKCPDNKHPHAINLGLPSGTKWACCNVGATDPEDYGGYYAWGETDEKSYYGNNTYAYYDSGKEKDTHIGDNIAGTKYDVAHVKWGGSWAMPTIEQVQELLGNGSQNWTKQNGVNGVLVTGKNGGTIFLPAAGGRVYDRRTLDGADGYYWSATQDSKYGDKADHLDFSYDRWSWYRDGRYLGYSVRPVCP